MDLCQWWQSGYSSFPFRRLNSNCVHCPDNAIIQTSQLTMIKFLSLEGWLVGWLVGLFIYLFTRQHIYSDIKPLSRESTDFKYILLSQYFLCLNFA